MSTNKDVIRQIFNEIFNQERYELIPACYCDHFQGSDPAIREGISGHDAIRTILLRYRKAFPNHQYVIRDMVEENDLLCVRWSVFNLIDGDDAPEIEGISMCAFHEGKIREVWQHWDNLGLMQSLGAVDKTLDVKQVVAGS